MREVRIGRGIFFAVALALTFYLLARVWNVLIPFVLGLVAAYMVQPLVDRFVSLGLRRDRTVLVLYVSLLAAVIGAGCFLIPNLIREANASLQSLPEYAARFNTINDKASAAINKTFVHLLGKKAHPMSLPFHADALAERFVTSLPENISSVAHFGLWIFIIPFVCYFALANGKEWMNTLFNLTPSDHVENLLGVVAEVNATLGAYIRGQLLDAMCVGLLTMAGLWAIGFDQAILFGILCGFLNPIPFLAPIVGGSLALLMAYFQGMPASSIVGIFFLFIIVRLCDDFIFVPFIVGQSVKLHPVIIMFAILAGVELGGFLGLVFAIPVTAVLKVVLSILLKDRRKNIFLVQHHIAS